MDPTDPAKTVRSILVEAFAIDPASLTDDTQLRRDLGADSLDLITLTMTLEETLSIDISDAQVVALSTVGELLNLIARAPKIK